MPKGCLFTVISFGSRFSKLKYSNSNAIPYNEVTKQASIQDIEKFEADHGGTDIVTPLRDVQNWRQKTNPKKRIFILTDGRV